MILTAEELEAITGFRRPGHQVAELRRRGWRFEVAASGRPIVSRAYAEAKLSGQSVTPGRVGPRLERV